MSKVRSLIKYALVTSSIGMVSLAYIAYNPPTFIIEKIRSEAEKQIFNATELPTKIGSFSHLRFGLFNQYIVAEGIEVLKSKQPQANTLLKSEKLEIGFNVLSYLLYGAEQSKLLVNIIKPDINISRDKQGLFDIDSPLLKSKEKSAKSSGKLNIPEVDLSISEANIKYDDKTFLKELSLDTKIPKLTFNIKNSKDMNFAINLQEKDNVIALKGLFDINSGSGEVDSALEVSNFPKWISIFYDLKKANLDLRTGDIKLNLKAKWDSYKFDNLNFKLDLDQKNTIAKLPYYNAPINFQNIAFTFDNDKLDIKNLKLNTYNSDLEIKGQTNYSTIDGVSNLMLKANNFDLEKVFKAIDKKLIPQSLIDLNLKGSTKLELKLEGVFPKIEKTAYLSYPKAFDITNIKSNIFLTKGNFMNSPIDTLASKVELDRKNVKLTNLYLKAFDGITKGNLAINNLFKNDITKTDIKKAKFEGSLITEKVEINKILKDFDVYIPLEYFPYGKINSNFKLTGFLTSPEIVGKAFSPELSFDKKYSEIKTISNVNADINYKKELIDVKTAINSSEYGQTKIDFIMKDLDEILVKAKYSNLQANTINAFVPSFNAEAGLFTGVADTSFSLKKLKKARPYTLASLSKIMQVKTKNEITQTNFSYSTYIERMKKLNGELSFNMGQGSLDSKFSLVTDNFGIFKGNLNLTPNHKLTTNIDVNSFPVKLAEKYIKNSSIKSGILDIKSKTTINLEKLEESSSPDNIAASINTSSKIKLREGNFSYLRTAKKKLTITDGFADVDFNLKNSILDSKLLLKSNEFGIADGYIKFDKDTNIDGKITNKEIKLVNLNNFTDLVDIKDGKLSLNIYTKGNLKKFNEHPESLVLETIVDIKKLKTDYFSKSKTYSFDINSYKNTLTYSNGLITTDMNLISNLPGNIDSKITLDFIKGDILGKVNTKEIDLSKFKDFIPKNTIDIQKGTIKINSDFKTNLNEVMSNYLKVNAKGSVYLKNFEVKLKKIDKEIHRINNLNVSYKFDNGLLNAENFKLKNNNSEIVGDLDLDLNKLFNKEDVFGNISLKSSNLNFNDFSFSKLAGIKDGSLKKLALNSNISKDYKKLDLNLNTEVKNLFLDNGTEINSLVASTDLKNNMLNIKNLSLINNENYLTTQGNVNIDNLKNPSFDLLIDSRKFPLKSILAILPDSLKKRTVKKSDEDNNKTLNTDKVTYRLRVKNKFAEKQEIIYLDELIKYWQAWSLPPISTDINSNSNNLNEKTFIEKIEGDLTTKANLKGSLDNPKLNTQLLISNAKVSELDINELFFNLNYNEGSFDIKKMHLLDNNGGYFELFGNIEKNGVLDFEAEGKLNLNWFDKLLNKDYGLEGNTLIALDVKGTKANPDINISFDANEGGNLSNLYFDKLSVIGNYKDDLVNISEASLKSGSKEAKISGIVPVDADNKSMNVSLGLTGESLGFINLFTKKIEWLKGDGDIFLNIQGSTSDPLINGNINIANAEVYFSSLEKSLKELEIDMSISNHFVKINKTSALLNNSRLDLLGQLDLIGFKPGFLKLKLVSNEFHWEQSNMNLFSRISLKITNTVSEPIIGGEVELQGGEYRLLGGSSKSTKITTEIKSKKPKPSSVDITFNKLDIKIPQETDFWIRSPFFDLRPYGTMKFRKGSIYSPVIDEGSTIKIDKGSLYLINNEFKISEAIAKFDGKEFDRDVFPINPQLTVLAQTKLNNARTNESTDVEAKITGELEDIPKNKMKIEWTKTGGLTDSEIWTQLIGISLAQKLISNPGESTSVLTNLANPYINKALFDPITSKLANFLTLDEFNVGLASDTLSNPGVVVSISKPIWGGISIGYQGTIRSLSSAQYNFFTKYRINKNINLKANLDERSSLSFQGELGYLF